MLYTWNLFELSHSMKNGYKYLRATVVFPRSKQWEASSFFFSTRWKYAEKLHFFAFSSGLLNGIVLCDFIFLHFCHWDVEEFTPTYSSFRIVYCISRMFYCSSNPRRVAFSWSAHIHTLIQHFEIYLHVLSFEACKIFATLAWSANRVYSYA